MLLCCNVFILLKPHGFVLKIWAAPAFIIPLASGIATHFFIFIPKAFGMKPKPLMPNF